MERKSVEDLPTLEDVPGVEIVPEDFKAIRNPILRYALLLFPWLILLIIIYILANYPLIAGVVMYTSGMLAAALSLFAFFCTSKDDTGNFPEPLAPGDYCGGLPFGFISKNSL